MIAAHPTEVRGLPAPLRGRDRCLVMGILNVTPDSFSDGGTWLDTRDAIAHGLSMVAAGADLVDVGGESTRPGAERVTADEELRRVLPVVRALVGAGTAVSIDTMRAATARAALDAGATVVNDVSGGLADRDMVGLVAQSGVPYVVMHWRAHSAEMARRAAYGDVVADVGRELSQRLAAVVDGGVDPAQVVLDPGLGFAKTAAHNWALLARLPALLGLGRPVLVGASRKAFLGALLAGADGIPARMEARDPATAAVSALAAAAGAWCVRVHDVPGSLAAVRVAAALTGAPSPAASPEEAR